MGATLNWIENITLLIGIGCILLSITQYGRRSSDWSGVVMMVFKRIPMNVAEYKWYRLGVALVIFAVVLRIIVLTLYP